MDISKILIGNNSISNLNQSKTSTSNNTDFSFKEVMNNEIEKLNNKQIQADEMIQGFIRGDIEDLHTVMIATEEARLALELAVQVRNKLVESYKEINNMQL